MTEDRAALEGALHRATGVVRSLAEPGDRLATCLPNSVAGFATGWALALEGVVEVPVPPSASADEARELLADARPRSLLLDVQDAPGVRAAAAALDLTVGSSRDTSAPAAVPGAVAPRTRAMAYTSGTTGRRKGVHVGIHDAAWGRAWLDEERAVFGGRHGDHHLVVSPLYHSGPFRHALACADAGGTVSVLPHFDVDLWLEALRTRRPTSMFCVPTHLHRLLRHPSLVPDDLASLTLLVHAGAPCPVGLKRRLHELAPDGAVWEFYGATEGQFTVCPPEVWEASPGTVGTARPGRTITVRDTTGVPSPADASGTVWTTTPAHGRWSYWDRPAATAAAWDEDRFTVGDIGHLDTHGRLTLDGRPGDLVVTGGVNVYPAEVERVLVDLDGVAEVVAFGVPDEEWGQRLVAAVVPDAGRPRPTPDRIRAQAGEHLSPARVPRQVVLVDELPRTATGKVRRTDLTTLVPR